MGGASETGGKMISVKNLYHNMSVVAALTPETAERLRKEMRGYDSDTKRALMKALVEVENPLAPELIRDLVLTDPNDAGPVSLGRVGEREKLKPLLREIPRLRITDPKAWNGWISFAYQHLVPLDPNKAVMAKDEFREAESSSAAKTRRRWRISRT
jgi:hypothetical protein